MYKFIENKIYSYRQFYFWLSHWWDVRLEDPSIIIIIIIIIILNNIDPMVAGLAELLMAGLAELLVAGLAVLLGVGLVADLEVLLVDFLLVVAASQDPKVVSKSFRLSETTKI